MGVPLTVCTQSHAEHMTVPSNVTKPGSDSAHLERPFSARFTLSSTPWCTQEEHLWDYAPDNGESCSGSVEPFGSSALTYVTANSTRIGRTYIKALYVEYTDENFTTVKVHGTLQARALCPQLLEGQEDSTSYHNRHLHFAPLTSLHTPGIYVTLCGSLTSHHCSASGPQLHLYRSQT